MVIETENLTKIYDGKVGCKEICLSVPEGQVFGFLGPNGAGKSTLVKMLVGLIYPTSGSARILGKPLGNLEVRREIGFLPEIFRYQDWLTGYQVLSFHCALYGIKSVDARQRIARVLDLVGLTGREGHRIKTYSRGMQQRIGLASALLPEPRLLFLDEPTSALDPIGRKEVRDIILTLKTAGTTIFLNSHLLSEVEQVCDAVAVINKGRIVTTLNMSEIKGGSSLEIVVDEVSEAIAQALRNAGIQFTARGTTITAVITDDREIPAVARLIVNNNGQLYRLNKRADSLEETFLNLLQDGGDKQ